MYNIDLDTIVRDKEQTLDLVEKVMSNNEITEKKRNNYPNGIRKYYYFKNSVELGTLKDNNRR